jgi:hypothetical protein
MAKLSLDHRQEFATRRRVICDKFLDLFGEELKIVDDEYLRRNHDVSREEATKLQLKEAEESRMKDPADSAAHVLITIAAMCLSIFTFVFFIGGGYRLVAEMTAESPEYWFCHLGVAVLAYQKFRSKKRVPQTFVEFAKQYEKSDRSQLRPE